MASPRGAFAEPIDSHSITAPFPRQAQIHEIRTSQRPKNPPAQVRDAIHFQNFACSTEQTCGYRLFQVVVLGPPGAHLRRRPLALCQAKIDSRR